MRNKKQQQVISGFEKPYRPKLKLMHVYDAGSDGLVTFSCAICNYQTWWMIMKSVSDAKKGLPCPRCNSINLIPKELLSWEGYLTNHNHDYQGD